MKIHSRLSFWLFVIGIISLFLPGCSPPAYDFHVVEKIAILDNIAYVRASRDCNFCDSVDGYSYFSSKDDGQTWSEITAPPDEMLIKHEQDKNNNSVLCLSEDTKICYRITNNEQVEISTDGGIAWQIDWQIPVGRKYYMQRYRMYPGPDTIPLDMKIVETEREHFVVLAMGNQGVLVKSSNGEWNRFAVGNAEPTPYQAANLSEAKGVLFNEWVAAILVAIGSLLFLSICSWVSAYVNSDVVLARRVFIACLPFILSISIFILYYLAAVSGQFRSFFSSDIQGVILVLPLLGFVISWLAIVVVSRNKGFGFLALMSCVILSIALYFFVFFPFQLWALGTIAVYETARMVVWLAGSIGLVISVIAEIKISILAVKQTAHQ